MAKDTDVARLRFVLTADPSGMRDGCKQAAGSLKEMASNTTQTVGRMDKQVSGGFDFKGLKSKAKGMKYLGKEMGGLAKGAIGDLFGIATMGATFGVAGAAVAGGAALYALAEKDQEKTAKERDDAFKSFREARDKGISGSTYRELKQIAGDDTKFLDDMALGMKKLKDAGPEASQSLQQFAKDIQAFRLSLGLEGAETETAKQEALKLSGEKRLSDVGKPPKSWFANVTDTPSKDLSLDVIKKELGLTDQQMREFAIPAMDGGWKRAPNETNYPGSGAAYAKYMGQYELKMQDMEAAIQKKAEGSTFGLKYRTNREVLNDELKQISEFRKAGGIDDTIAGRATFEVLANYRKGEGSGLKMAGVAAYGSAEAYATIAEAQMAALGVKDQTQKQTEILVGKFDELKAAVENVKANWKTADDN